MVKINIRSETTSEFSCDYCKNYFRDGGEAIQIENPWDEAEGYMIVDSECHESIEHQRQTVGHVEDYTDYMRGKDEEHMDDVVEEGS